MCADAVLPPMWINRNRVDAVLPPVWINRNRFNVRKQIEARLCDGNQQEMSALYNSRSEHCKEHMFDTTCPECRYQFLIGQKNYEFRGPVSHGDHVFDTSCDMCHAAFQAEQPAAEFEFSGLDTLSLLPTSPTASSPASVAAEGQVLAEENVPLPVSPLPPPDIAVLPSVPETNVEENESQDREEAVDSAVFKEEEDEKVEEEQLEV